jgi:hypothetical protein
MIGIYVHDTSGTPYAEAIVGGYKTIETRNRNVLGQFIGQRVAVVRTKAGHKAEIIGTVRIVNGRFLTESELDAMRNQTCIPPGSKFDCHGRGKWGYRLAHPEPCEPQLLSDHKIVHRTMSWVEYEEGE